MRTRATGFLAPSCAQEVIQRDARVRNLVYSVFQMLRELVWWEHPFYAVEAYLNGSPARVCWKRKDSSLLTVLLLISTVPSI